MPNQADQKPRKPTTQKVRAGTKNVVSHDHHDGKKRSQGMGGAKSQSKRAHKRMNEGSGSRQVERKKKRPVHDSAIHGVRARPHGALLPPGVWRARTALPQDVTHPA